LYREVRGAKRLPHADEDVAAPERSEPRALSPDDCERDERRAGVLCHVGDTRTPAVELTRFAAMSFGEEAERLTSGDDVERHLERAAVRLAAAHRERADRDRKSTRLNSSHVAISYAVFC